MWMYTTSMWESVAFRRGHHISWTLIKGECELSCGFLGTNPRSSAKEGSDFSCKSISLAPLRSGLNSHTRYCIRYHNSKTSNNCMIGQDAPGLGLGIEDSFPLEDKAFFFSLLVVITPAIWLCLLPNEWCSSDTVKVGHVSSTWQRSALAPLYPNSSVKHSLTGISQGEKAPQKESTIFLIQQ